MVYRITFFLFLLSSSEFCKAQIVTEEVNFDYYIDESNNDFVNHFSGGLGMSQIETDGITGGSVITPDSSSWGNDNAIYCSKYKPLTGDTTITAISFRYDSALIHPNSFQRALSIFLRPQADYNHYIIASVSGNKKIELLTYSWNNNPYPPLTLHTNHWYRYVLTVIFSTITQIKITAEVFDLGIDGTSDPFLVNSSSGSFNDAVLATDTSIQVSVTSARYGGATHLDDFYFEGREGFTNCTNIATGIAEDPRTPSLNIYPTPAKDRLSIEYNGMLTKEMSAALFNIRGETILNFLIHDQKTILDVHLLPAGMYYLRCISAGSAIVSPVVVVR